MMSSSSSTYRHPPGLDSSKKSPNKVKDLVSLYSKQNEYEERYSNRSQGGGGGGSTSTSTGRRDIGSQPSRPPRHRPSTATQDSSKVRVGSDYPVDDPRSQVYPSLSQTRESVNSRSSKRNESPVSLPPRSPSAHTSSSSPIPPSSRPRSEQRIPSPYANSPPPSSHQVQTRDLQASSVAQGLAIPQELANIPGLPAPVTSLTLPRTFRRTNAFEGEPSDRDGLLPPGPAFARSATGSASPPPNPNDRGRTSRSTMNSDPSRDSKGHRSRENVKVDRVENQEGYIFFAGPSSSSSPAVSPGGVDASHIQRWQREQEMTGQSNEAREDRSGGRHAGSEIPYVSERLGQGSSRTRTVSIPDEKSSLGGDPQVGRETHRYHQEPGSRREATEFGHAPPLPAEPSKLAKRRKRPSTAPDNQQRSEAARLSFSQLSASSRLSNIPSGIPTLSAISKSGSNSSNLGLKSQRPETAQTSFGWNKDKARSMAQEATVERTRERKAMEAAAKASASASASGGTSDEDRNGKEKVLSGFAAFKAKLSRKDKGKGKADEVVEVAGPVVSTDNNQDDVGTQLPSLRPEPEPEPEPEPSRRRHRHHHHHHRHHHPRRQAEAEESEAHEHERNRASATNTSNDEPSPEVPQPDPLEAPDRVTEQTVVDRDTLQRKAMKASQFIRHSHTHSHAKTASSGSNTLPSEESFVGIGAEDNFRLSSFPAPPVTVSRVLVTKDLPSVPVSPSPTSKTFPLPEALNRDEVVSGEQDFSQESSVPSVETSDLSRTESSTDAVGRDASPAIEESDRDLEDLRSRDSFTNAVPRKWNHSTGSPRDAHDMSRVHSGTTILEVDSGGEETEEAAATTKAPDQAQSETTSADLSSPSRRPELNISPVQSSFSQDSRPLSYAGETAVEASKLGRSGVGGKPSRSRRTSSSSSMSLTAPPLPRRLSSLDGVSGRTSAEFTRARSSRDRKSDIFKYGASVGSADDFPSIDGVTSASKPTSPRLDGVPDAPHSDALASGVDDEPSNIRAPSISNAPTNAMDEGESKRIKRRRHALRELAETERQFAVDVAIIRDVYLARAKGVPLSAIKEHLRASAFFFTPPSSPMAVHAAFPVNTRHSVALSDSTGAASTTSAPISELSLSLLTPATTPTPTSSSSVNVDASGSSPAMSPANIRVVFANIEAVASLAEVMSGMLHAAKGSEPDNVAEVLQFVDAQDDRVGDVFIEMIPRIQQVYATYCTRHDAAIFVLQQLASDLQLYFDECKSLAQARTNAWDLPSLLIKPVQRCLKYPLLLDQILRYTNEDHPDFSSLQKAKEAMQRVAEHINEAKKSSDLVGKIISKPNGSKREGRLGGRRSLPESTSTSATAKSIGRGVTKKLGRQAHKLKQSFGVVEPGASSVEDIFQAFVAQFNAQESGINEFASSVRAWTIFTKRTLLSQQSLLRSWADVYRPVEGEVQLLGVPGGLSRLDVFTHTVLDVVLTGPYHNMESKVKTLILSPCDDLGRRFNNPRTILAKREIKRIDHERYLYLTSKKDKSAERHKEGSVAYLAISAQLLDDLPRFISATNTYFDAVVARFAIIQRSFFRSLSEVLRPFVDQNCQELRSNEATQKTFEDAHGTVDEMVAGLFIVQQDPHFMHAIPQGERSRQSTSSALSIGSGTTSGFLSPHFSDHSFESRTRQVSQEFPPRSSWFGVRRAKSSPNTSQIDVSDSPPPPIPSLPTLRFVGDPDNLMTSSSVESGEGIVSPDLSDSPVVTLESTPSIRQVALRTRRSLGQISNLRLSTTSSHDNLFALYQAAALTSQPLKSEAHQDGRPWLRVEAGDIFKIYREEQDENGFYLLAGSEDGKMGWILSDGIAALDDDG